MVRAGQAQQWHSPRAMAAAGCHQPGRPGPAVMPHDGPQLLAVFCLTLAYAGDAALRVAWQRLADSLGARS
jgi:hypothetical protein